MWINNHDDPKEMDIATALILLTVNNWKNAPRTAGNEYTFVSPGGELHPCEDDEAVIDLVEAQGLAFPEVAQ